jgi:hypothetical protein
MVHILACDIDGLSIGLSIIARWNRYRRGRRHCGHFVHLDKVKEEYARLHIIVFVIKAGSPDDELQLCYRHALQGTEYGMIKC